MKGNLLKSALALLIALSVVFAGAACVFLRPAEQSAVITEAPDVSEAVTEAPSAGPTSAPAPPPTGEPTAAPIGEDTPEPITEEPTPAPTAPPTEKPTPAPTPAPTPKPTKEPTPKPTKTPKPTGSHTAKPSATPGPAFDPSDVTMMFVGDLMCLSGQQYAAMNQAGSGADYDFRPSFDYVKSILSRADIAMGNLETTLSGSWPYATEEKEIDGMPNCNGPAEFLQAVKYAGFDALALANNHCCDAGVTGILETLDAVDQYGLKHTGLFRTESESRYKILNVGGIKVGLLSYAEFYNHKESCVYEAGCPFMINTYSESTARRDIAAAKAAGAEFIIVYEHWGREHTHEPTELQLKHARQLANAGADLICGSHSHTVQPSVWLEADDGRRVLCAYSLGNFVSSMSQSASNDTVIMELRIGRSGGRTVIKNETYHPCRVIRQVGGKCFVVVPTSETSIPSIRAELEAAEDRIMRILMSKR